jgi:hypothetical protein
MALIVTLCKYAVLPVIQAAIAVLWKLLSKNKEDWLPDDRLLVSELLVTATFVQLTLMVDSVNVSQVGGNVSFSAADWQALVARALVLLALVVVVLPASALALRSHTRRRRMTNRLAHTLSALTVGFLLLLVILDYVLPDALRLMGA